MPLIDARVEDKRHQLKDSPVVFNYDHCPYCIKARMIFGLKKIKYEPRFLSNDDFDTPIKLIGKKAVPILEMTHDSGEKVIMSESLNIVRYVDGHPGFNAGGVILKESQKAEAIGEITKHSEMTLPAMIRFPKCSTLPEFHSKEARETFIIRHGLTLGGKAISWDDAYAKDAEVIKTLNGDLLPKVEALIDGPFVNGTEPSYDDINLWPFLRNLTLVKGLKFGAKTQAYLEHLSEACDITNYNAIAI